MGLRRTYEWDHLGVGEDPLLRCEVFRRLCVLFAGRHLRCCRIVGWLRLRRILARRGHRLELQRDVGVDDIGGDDIRGDDIRLDVQFRLGSLLHSHRLDRHTRIHGPIDHIGRLIDHVRLDVQLRLDVRLRLGPARLDSHRLDRHTRIHGLADDVRRLIGHRLIIRVPVLGLRGLGGFAGRLSDVHDLVSR